MNESLTVEDQLDEKDRKKLDSDASYQFLVVILTLFIRFLLAVG
jgi:hypothetical protein